MKSYKVHVTLFLWEIVSQSSERFCPPDQCLQKGRNPAQNCGYGQALNSSRDEQDGFQATSWCFLNHVTPGPRYQRNGVAIDLQKEKMAYGKKVVIILQPVQVTQTYKVSNVASILYWKGWFSAKNDLKILRSIFCCHYFGFLAFGGISDSNTL
jgi:hypothetical protein